MVAANSALQPKQSFEDFSAVMRTGRIGAPGKIKHVAVEIKHVIEAVGCIAAESRFRAYSVGWPFAANEHGGKQRAEFPLSRNIALLFIFDQNAGAVRHAEAESRGVIDLS